MTDLAWFANSGTLTVTIGATTFSVAALQNVSFTPKYETVPLYGMESTHRKAVARHSLSVDVKFKYAMWNPDADIILGSVLNGEYLSPTGVATDADTAGLRSKLAVFNVVATQIDSTRARQVTATAYNVYFDSLPWEMTQNEWIVRDLTGVGESVAFCTSTVA